MNRILPLASMRPGRHHCDLPASMADPCPGGEFCPPFGPAVDSIANDRLLDVRSSEQTFVRWSGRYTTSTLTIGRCRLLPTRQPMAMQQTIVGLHIGRAVSLKWSTHDGEDRLSVAAPGNIYVATSDRPLWLSWVEPIDVFMIAIEREYLESVRRCFGLHHIDITTGLVATDASLGQIIGLFQHVMEESAPATQAYLESAASALIAYLSQRTEPAPAPSDQGGRLSAEQLQRVVTYVEHHLGETVSLSALAEVAGLSLYYFANAFRRTTGTTPHRFVVDRKISHGRMLLTDHGLAIPEVAAALGFASQSHFTQQFRRVTGTTPGRYQRSLR